MFSYREVIWRIKYNIEKRPVCKSCGKPVSFVGKQSWEKVGKTKNGYLTFCCKKCSNNDTEVQKKVKETSIKRYGEKREILRRKFEKTMLLKYGVKNALQNKELLNKAKTTIFEHYGVTSPAKNDMVKKKMAETNIKKYGYVAPACSQEVLEKIKLTNSLKYGVECYFETDDYIKIRKENYKKWVDKAVNTAILNGTINTSKPEEKLYSLLSLIFGEKDIIRQYKSNEYPFPCDFYLVNEDIYIEYNGTYFHNKCLYDAERDKERHEAILLKCSVKHPSYKRILDVWCGSDVKKYNTAKENGLNMLFLYRKWDQDWFKYTKGKTVFSEENIIEHLKSIIFEQLNNKSVKVIGEEYD